VATLLHEEAVSALTMPAPGSTDAVATPEVKVWTWNEQQGTVQSAAVPARRAALHRGTRFARDAFRIAPERTEAQALYLAFLLESEAAQAGTIEPPGGPGTAYNLTLAAGPATASDVLRLALRYELPRAAVGALAAIAQTASPSILYSDDDLVSSALNDPNPRVQLAAAITVLQLNPERPFRQSKRV